MKKLLAFIFCFLTTPVFAASALLPYQAGPRLIDGTQLNLMVSAVNGLTGNTGTPSKGYFSLNTATSGPTPAAGTIIQAVGANAAATARIEIDAFGGIPVFTARRANGTKALPTAILTTQEFGSFNFHGALSSTVYGAGARVSAFATENWSATASGTKIVFSTVPNTTLTLTDAVTIGQDQSLTVVGAITGPSVSVTGNLTTKSGTAVPASAGAVAAGAPITMFSGGNKIWITSDVPSFSATKGDICINTGGSSTSTRLYINNGTTNWIAITTAS